MPALSLKMNLEEKGLDAIALLMQKHGSNDPEVLRASGDLIVMGNEARVEVGVMPRGMQSGKASVMFCFTLPDGKVVLVETSLAVFLAAAQAFNARHGTG